MTPLKRGFPVDRDHRQRSARATRRTRPSQDNPPHNTHDNQTSEMPTSGKEDDYDKVLKPPRCPGTRPKPHEIKIYFDATTLEPKVVKGFPTP